MGSGMRTICPKSRRSPAAPERLIPRPVKLLWPAWMWCLETWASSLTISASLRELASRISSRPNGRPDGLRTQLQRCGSRRGLGAEPGNRSARSVCAESQPSRTLTRTAIPTFLTTGLLPPQRRPIGTNGRYPLPPGVSVYFFFDPLNSYRIPLSDSWNFSVQHQSFPDLHLEAAYVGNVGRHLFLNPNRNQAVPGPGDYRSAAAVLPSTATRKQSTRCATATTRATTPPGQGGETGFSRPRFPRRRTRSSKALDNGEGGYGFVEQLRCPERPWSGNLRPDPRRDAQSTTGISRSERAGTIRPQTKFSRMSLADGASAA